MCKLDEGSKYSLFLFRLSLLCEVFVQYARTGIFSLFFYDVF